MWSIIYNWFVSFTERDTLLREFNLAARNAFISGITPMLIEASTSFGDSSFKHSFSKIRSGFRVKVLTGRSLTTNECQEFADVVIHNEPLARKLVALGWDTLEIYSFGSSTGHKWNLGRFVNIGLSLNS